MVAALTSNFASKNTSIFSAAEEALDEFIKHIGRMTQLGLGYRSINGSGCCFFSSLL